MRILGRWISGVSIALFSSVAHAQERANDLDQRSIELAAARAVVSLRPSFADWALDPRMYVYGVTKVGTDGSLSVEPLVAPATEMPSSHDSEHLAAVADALGIRAILDDARSCAVLAAHACRIGAFNGTVSFGPAWVRGKTAEINVAFWHRVDRQAKDGTITPTVIGGGAAVTCELTQKGWQVVRVTHIQF